MGHSRRHVVAVELNEKLKVLRWNLEFRQGSVRCGCGCCACFLVVVVVV